MDRRNVAVALAVLQATAVAGAAQTNFELALDTAIEESLRPRDPQSADLWRLAAEAGYRRDLDEAVRLYDELLTRDPSCAPALWAKGGALVERGRREAGIALGRQAIDVDPSPVNLAALSLMLGGKRATDAEKGEAFELASRAASTLSPHPTSRPEDAAVNLALCRAAMDVPGHSSDAYLAAHRLSEIAGPEASACRADVLAMTGRKAAAAREIGAAREAERRETAANRARREEREAAAVLAAPRSPRRPWSILDVLKWTLLGWLSGLVVLLALGGILGGAVLRTADELARRSRGASPMGGAGLRRAYSVVLWLSCAYYYASIPLLALLTVALGGGLLYLFFAARHVPVKIALVVLVLTLVTLWSILKSLFVRGSDEDPGLRLDLRGQPLLRALLDDVASRVGTDVAVMERGGLALAVRRSLVTMARTLAENGAAAWYNPVWLFLNGFYRVPARFSGRFATAGGARRPLGGDDLRLEGLRGGPAPRHRALDPVRRRGRTGARRGGPAPRGGEPLRPVRLVPGGGPGGRAGDQGGADAQAVALRQPPLAFRAHPLGTRAQREGHGGDAR